MYCALSQGELEGALAASGLKNAGGALKRAVCGGGRKGGGCVRAGAAASAAPLCAVNRSRVGWALRALVGRFSPADDATNYPTRARRQPHTPPSARARVLHTTANDASKLPFPATQCS